jgi:hypothetical protein
MSSRFICRYALGALLACTAAVTQAQITGHGVHPPLPDQEFYLYCRVTDAGQARVIESELKIPSPTLPAELDQVVELPEPHPALRIVQYLPRAELEQRVEPQPDGRPAIELSVEGPTQSYRLWLVAGDTEHNRLTSLIGTWRYMAAANGAERNELLKQFQDELTRPPTIVIMRADGGPVQTLPAEPGPERELEGLGCKVRVAEFYPDFSMDRATRKPSNQSDKRRNPAVLVELDQGGKKEERWVFAKFPDFQTQRAEGRLPYRITLDCPIDTKRTTPDCLLITLGDTQEAWLRHAGRTKVHVLKVGETVDVPESQYTFAISQFVPAGRLIEEYHASEKKAAVAALRVVVQGTGEDPVSLWLEPSKERTANMEQGPLVVWFGPREAITSQPTHTPAP